jgi:adenosylcobinamide-GDP ribazoletransferase
MIRAALTTLTRLPIAGTGTADTGPAGFGVAGAIVGLAGFIALAVLGQSMPILAAILAVGAMAAISGALHLDGLADTADALLAPDPETAERARKDPRLGIGGALALVIVISLDVVALAQLAVERGGIVAGLACVVAAASGRALAVAVARAGRRRRSDGWGGRFAEEVTPVAIGVALGSVAAIAVLAGALVDWSLTSGAAAGAAIGAAAGWLIVRWRGQLDGDVLGATVELTCCASLVATAIFARAVG